MFCRFSYFRADLRKQTGNFRKLFYCVVRLYVVVIFYSFGIEPDGCYPGIYAAFYVRAQAVSDYNRLAEREIGYFRKTDIKELLVRLIGAENLRDKYAVHIFCDSGASYPALAIGCAAIENEYGNTPARRAKLDWLLYNRPLEYAQLVLGGEIKHYLSLGCDHSRLED